MASRLRPASGIRQGVLLWAVALFVVLSSLSLWLSWQTSERAAWRSSEQFAQALMSSLVIVGERTVVADPGLAEEMVVALATDTRVQYVAVINPQGRVHAATRRADRGKPAADLGLAVEGAPRGEDDDRTRLALDPERQRIVLHRSFLWPQPEDGLRSLARGHLHAVIDVSQPLQASRRVMLIEQAALAVVFGIGALLMYLWFRGRLVQPLQALQHAANQLAKGNFSARAQAEGTREVQAVAQSFNRMSGTLQHLVERLSESEQRYRGLVDLAPIAILSVGADGRIEEVNQAAERMFGYAPDSLRGCELNLLLPQDVGARHVRWIQDFRNDAGEKSRSMASGRVVKGRTRHGQLIDVEISIAKRQTGPTRDAAGGGGVTFTAVVRDVTERLQMEFSLQEYRDGLEALVARRTEQLTQANEALDASRRSLEGTVRELSTKTTVIDRAPFPILILDADDEATPVRSVNAAFTEATGYAAADMLGQHPRQLFGAATAPAEQQAVEDTLRERRAGEVELAVVRADGGVRTMRWLIFPSYAPEGALLSLVVCLIDVTELRQAEVERLRLAQEFQEAAKMEFLSLTIAGIAHDLNTPIGIAITAASHLQQMAQKLHDGASAGANDAAALPARMARSAELITNNLAKASKLVQSFKQTTADVNRSEWRPVNLSDLLESLLVTLGPVLKRAQCAVDLRCPDRLVLHTDPGSISQALTNLIINATIHAFQDREDRRIRMEVSEGTSGIDIVLSDNGNGMGQEALAKAFTPFYTSRRGSGGSGLGLFSSRRVIEQVLGGRIAVDSSPGVGTTFTIWLPRRKPDGG